MRRRTLQSIIAFAILTSLALVASACSSSSGAKPESGVIAGINFIDKAGLHEISVSINEKNEVPATARTVALQAAAVVRTTEWPSDQRTAARTLATKLSKFAEALDKEPVDMKAAGALAEEVHDGAHEFSKSIWESLYKTAGLPVAEGDHAE